MEVQVLKISSQQHKRIIKDYGGVSDGKNKWNFEGITSGGKVGDIPKSWKFKMKSVWNKEMKYYQCLFIIFNDANDVVKDMILNN